MARDGYVFLSIKTQSDVPGILETTSVLPLAY